MPECEANRQLKSAEEWLIRPPQVIKLPMVEFSERNKELLL